MKLNLKIAIAGAIIFMAFGQKLTAKITVGSTFGNCHSFIVGDDTTIEDLENTFANLPENKKADIITNSPNNLVVFDFIRQHPGQAQKIAILSFQKELSEIPEEIALCTNLAAFVAHDYHGEEIDRLSQLDNLLLLFVDSKTPRSVLALPTDVVDKVHEKDPSAFCTQGKSMVHFNLFNNTARNLTTHGPLICNPQKFTEWKKAQKNPRKAKRLAMPDGIMRKMKISFS
ncbi:hypothetical protein HOD08_02855 [bacterium]|nr:hypothetical protein [bacterium]